MGRGLSQGGLAQILDPGHETMIPGVLALATHGGCFRGAHAHEHGVVTLVHDVVHGQVHAHVDPVLDLRAHALHQGDLLLEDVPGQTVVRDAHGGHAPALGVGLEDGALVAHPAQVKGAGQPGRTGPDHGHLLVPGLLGPVVGLGLGRDLAVRGKALEPLYGDGLVHQRPAAVKLAGADADPADGPGHGAVVADHDPKPRPSGRTGVFSK